MSNFTAANIRKQYQVGDQTLDVLTDISFDIQSGESVAIMGPSGCGKSTLLNILGALEKPDGGHVKLGNTDPFALNERALAQFRNRNIGFIFQEHHLLPQCTVLENVLIPTLVNGDPQAEEGRARELLDRVGLSQRIEHRPAELSGGERQRVAIARALINEPDVLLADEPTGNLDEQTADGIADLLRDVQRDAQTILIVVTHSAEIASRFGRQWRLAEGRMQELTGATM